MRILCLNSGSSSIKFALYSMESEGVLIFTATIKRIGLNDSALVVKDQQGTPFHEQKGPIENHLQALEIFFSWTERQKIKFDAIGHRIVHGGAQYISPCLITDDVVSTLHKLAPFDPEHLPDEMLAIEIAKKFYPTCPQVACFDTAFHASLPTVAKYFAIPRNFWKLGIYRYGFHGLSYEYIMYVLEKIDPQLAKKGKIIIAHLGNGASMAAVNAGRCIDTTMGFTPVGGLVMSSRSGDLDPSVLIYLQQEVGLSVDELNRILNQESGLLGVSGVSGDMQNLLQIAAEDQRAQEAIDLFCYHAKKSIGAFKAVLEGLDCLVFTGGIGESSVEIRKRISVGCEDEIIKVIPTNEEFMIARHTLLTCVDE